MQFYSIQNYGQFGQPQIVPCTDYMLYNVVTIVALLEQANRQSKKSRFLTTFQPTGMFCKYKTFCIAPNQNTIADLLLNEATDIAINFGIRIQSSPAGPFIEVSHY